MRYWNRSNKGQKMSKMFSCTNRNMCLLQERQKQEIVFKPPKNPTYSIIDSNSKSSFGNCFKKLDFKIENIDINTNIPKWLDVSFYNITKEKRTIILIYIKNTSQKNSNTLLYSHSHSTDIGSIIPILIDFSIQFKSDIISYDYSGYGRSNGKTKLENLIPNIDAVIDFLIHDLNVCPDKILLFGRDLGAIPSVYLGTKYQNLTGMILLSPLFGDAITEKSLKVIKIPTFIIHGRNDTSFLQKTLSELVKNIPKVAEWYPKADSPNMIIDTLRYKFYGKIKQFIVQVQNKQDKISFLLSISSMTPSDTDNKEIEIKKNGSLRLIENNYKINESEFQSLDKCSSLFVDDKSRLSNNESQYKSNSKRLQYDDDSEEEEDSDDY